MIETAEEIEEFIHQFHTHKDPAHDLDHIRRVKFQIQLLCKELKQPVGDLLYSLYFHGLKESEISQLENYFEKAGFTKERIQQWKSFSSGINSKEELSNIESKILHDAHILEGGPFYFGIKSMITGSHRDQTMRQTIDILEHNLSKATCYFEVTKKKLDEQVTITRKMIQSLRNNLP